MQLPVTIQGSIRRRRRGISELATSVVVHCSKE
jgi:hypothetical protein